MEERNRRREKREAGDGREERGEEGRGKGRGEARGGVTSHHVIQMPASGLLERETRRGEEEEGTGGRREGRGRGEGRRERERETPPILRSEGRMETWERRGKRGKRGKEEGREQ